jgi:hypothetical protein
MSCEILEENLSQCIFKSDLQCFCIKKILLFELN